MRHIEAFSGNKAMATGVKLSRPNVVCAYPITPQTTVVEYLSEFVNDGELDAEYIESEGEHGMLWQAVGAAQAGARVFTSTCGQGSMYGYEAWPNMAHRRYPIVIGIVNRSCDLTIYTDHTDSMCARDWAIMQLYAEHAQESLDTIIQAYKIAEDKRVLLPAFVCHDGFYVSYTTEPVDVPEQEEVDEFLPPYKPVYPVLDPRNLRMPVIREPRPPTIEALMADGLALKIAAEKALTTSKDVIKEVNEEFGKKFGRRYGNGLVEEYMMEDAEVALVTLGSMTGSARSAVEEMRRAGKKIGLIRVRAFRPFPAEELRQLGKNLRAMVVCDRNFVQTGTGGVGALFLELKHALWPLKEKPLLLNFIVGIAGLEISARDFRYFIEKGFKTVEKGVVEREVEYSPIIDLVEVTEWKEPPPERVAKITWPSTTQCQGCGENLAIRIALEVLGKDTVTVGQVGCGGYTDTSVCIPTGFGWLPGGPACAAGISRAFKALGKKDINVVLLAGDGSYGDMGFMAASGAAERNEDMIVLVVDNEAYMNTGGQRSGTTSYKARTTTTPVGTVKAGKETPRKDLPLIMAGHHIPYIATASLAYVEDYRRKLEKAKGMHGHRFIHVLAPCPTGWRMLPGDTVKASRLAVQSGIWPLYEIDQGRFRFTYKPKERAPVMEYLSTQGRFRHLTEEDVKSVQTMTDETYTRLEGYEKVGTVS